MNRISTVTGSCDANADSDAISRLLEEVKLVGSQVEADRGLGQAKNTLSTCLERIEARRQERERAAIARMRVNRDEIEGVTWYRDPSSPLYLNSRSAVYLYMGHRGSGSPWLRFVIQYVGEDWLFIRRFVFKADAQTFTIEPGHFGVERDNDSRIWEWYDTAAGPTELSIARAVSESDTAVIRHEGEHYQRDRIISAAEKAAIRNVLEAYNALSRNPSYKR